MKQNAYTSWGGEVIWVDADPKIRYERIQSANRGRGSEDNKTYKEFLADEEREMHPSGDAATLNMAGVKALADIKLINESTVGELEKAIVAEIGL